MFEVHVRDSQVTGRSAVGSATLPLSCLPLKGGKASLWLPLRPSPPPGVEALREGISNQAGAGANGECGAAKYLCVCVDVFV